MKDLFLKTNEGNIPISQEIVDKYNIKEGTVSPFTKFKVVNKDGSYINEEKSKIDVPLSKMPEGEGLADDEIVEFSTGAILSTSEIIDFSQGTDSSPD